MRFAGRIGRLTGVLQVVGDHTDQADAEGDRRVPGRVHDPVQVGVPEGAQVADGLLVHRVVIAGQQLAGLRADGVHLLEGMPVAVVGRVEGQREPLRPPLAEPDLGPAGHVGDVIVLDPGEMPDQPGDRVALAVGPGGQLLGREPVDALGNDLTNPAEGIGQDFG